MAVAPDALSRVWAISTKEPIRDEWYNLLCKQIREGKEEGKDFNLENEQLFRYCIGLNEMGVPGFVWKRVLPFEDREELIKEEQKRLEHLGFKKCHASLQKWFWWPKMA